MRNDFIEGHFLPEKFGDLRREILKTKNNAAKEQYFKIVAKHIFENHEKDFTEIVDGPKYQGTPFDFFGKKGDRNVIVELKGSLNKFGFPGDVQYVRMKDLIYFLGCNGCKVEPFLLQIHLDRGTYRIYGPKFLNEKFKEMDDALGKHRPIENIGRWVIDRI